MDKLVEYAVEMTRYFQKGKVFIVQDLFPNFCWEGISLNERKMLGKNFFSYVDNNKHLNIKALDKTVLNQQKYKKL